jgi:hypothetical protein
MPAAKVSIREDQAVGFDMMLEPPNFLVGSDGGEVRAPRHYRARERKLRPGPAASVARQAGQPESRESPTARGQNSGAHREPAAGVFAPVFLSRCHNVVGKLALKI